MWIGNNQYIAIAKWGWLLLIIHPVWLLSIPFFSLEYDDYTETCFFPPEYYDYTETCNNLCDLISIMYAMKLLFINTNYMNFRKLMGYLRSEPLFSHRHKIAKIVQISGTAWPGLARLG